MSTIEVCDSLKYSRNQVSLELVEIDVQGSIKTKGRGNRGDNLGDQPVEIGEARGGDIEPLLADIIDSFIIHLFVVF